MDRTNLIEEIIRKDHSVDSYNSTLTLIKGDLYHRNYLLIPTANGDIHLEHSDILYCQAAGSYSLIFVKNAKKICVSKILKWVEERLPSKSFIRIHQSFLINKHIIDFIDYKKHASIVLHEGIRIPISRSRRKSVKQILMT